MREQIKELCLFMICGQTLLYFQSGKKYEKICRMILELLVLAGIVGMILNFLQSLGMQKGEMQALGGAVASMQRSMEEALTKQLDAGDLEEDFISGISMESLVEKYTMEEIKSKYNSFAEQYGYEIEEVKQKDDKLHVLLKEKPKLKQNYEEKSKEKTAEEGMEENSLKESETKEENDETAAMENPVGIADIEQIKKVEIEKIDLGEGERTGEETGQNTENKENPEKTQTDKEQLASFRRQLAFVLVMDEEDLEVILIE